MFDKFKQLKQLRDMQKQLQKQTIEAEKNGVKVVLNGLMQVEQIELADELDRKAQAESLKQAFNDAVKQMQKKMAQEMRGTDMGSMF